MIWLQTKCSFLHFVLCLLKNKKIYVNFILIRVGCGCFYGKKLARIKWVDMAKGYGIIFTIFAHIILSMLVKYDAYSYVVRWIYTFSMPLFFFFVWL